MMSCFANTHESRNQTRAHHEKTARGRATFGNVRESRLFLLLSTDLAQIKCAKCKSKDVKTLLFLDDTQNLAIRVARVCYR